MCRSNKEVGAKLGKTLQHNSGHCQRASIPPSRFLFKNYSQRFKGQQHSLGWWHEPQNLRLWPGTNFPSHTRTSQHPQGCGNFVSLCFSSVDSDYLLIYTQIPLFVGALVMFMNKLVNFFVYTLKLTPPASNRRARKGKKALIECPWFG